MFYYSDTAPRTAFQGDVWKMDANKGYMRHYDNMLYLTFMANNGTFVEKQQAAKEILICQRKLDFWKRHPNFEDSVVDPLVEKANKQWAQP